MKYAIFLFVCFIMSCTQKFELQEGDLLFQDMDCGPMCDAIEEVTQGVNGANLSHVGLVVFQNDSAKVVEAISKGVVFTPLNDFLNRSSDADGNPKVLVGRLKEEYRSLVPEAIQSLKKYQGCAYNQSYLMGNDSVYCSQLMYLIFKEANHGQDVFQLAPMTFKPLNSDAFFEVWADYYNDLGIPIPEGEPGINPGGMSQSKYIDIVHVYGIPDGFEF